MYGFPPNSLLALSYTGVFGFNLPHFGAAQLAFQSP
jgi:hypothetical protein